jgi:hypothetical protein
VDTATAPAPIDAPATSRAEDRRFATFVAVAFFAVVALAMLRHEMWRDELEAFLAARDSTTPVDVVRNTRYNGHPVTWYLLLHAVTRVTHDPRGMQLLHACLATIGVYVFARYSPFSRLQRALFCFGYFPLFEYGVISREYVLGVVMLFAFCAAYGAGANLIVLALIAGLLAQTNAYGLMLSLALVATVIIEMFLRRGTGDPPVFEAQNGRAAHVTWMTALLIFVVAVSLAILQLMPPSDTGTVVGWSLPSWKMFPLVMVWRALVPVPPLTWKFWNENIVGGNKHAAPLGMLLFPVVFWMLRKHRPALLMFAIGSMGLLTFAFVKFYGSIRHHGHLYLVLIAALWIAASEGRWHGRLSDHTAIGERGLDKGLSRAFTALLVVHVIAAVIAISIDWVRPFSQSRATAAYIRDHGLGGAFIVGEKDTPAAAIAAYLDRQIYFPRGDRIGSYIIYDQRRLAFDPANLLDVCRRKAREHGGEVLLVSTSPLPSGTAGVRPVGELTGSIVNDEDFWLYLVAPQ